MEATSGPAKGTEWGSASSPCWRACETQGSGVENEAAGVGGVGPRVAEARIRIGGKARMELEYPLAAQFFNAAQEYKTRYLAYIFSDWRGDSTIYRPWYALRATGDRCFYNLLKSGEDLQNARAVGSTHRPWRQRPRSCPGGGGCGGHPPCQAHTQHSSLYGDGPRPRSRSAAGGTQLHR